MRSNASGSAKASSERVDVELDVGLSFRRGHEQELLDASANRKGLGPHLDRARLEPREVEELIDQAAQAVALLEECPPQLEP